MPQFPLMRATVRAFGMIPVEQDRYEADDLIATYARQARERGADVLIVSADKDLMQLIEPGVAMYDPASGDREERRIGPAEVVDYFGAGPDKVVDIQALAGDSTDNVPGAPGIGVKTAAQLIGEYGDLETLLARAGEIKQPKRREALTAPENVERIRISKTLVTLVRDVAVETPLDDLAAAEARRQGARRLPEGDGAHHDHPPGRRDLRRRRLRDRARPALRRRRPGGRGATARRRSRRRRRRRLRRPRRRRAVRAPGAATPRGSRAGARRRSEGAGRPCGLPHGANAPTSFDAWIARAHEAGLVAFDAETTSLDPLQADLVGVSLAVAPGEACYIPLGHRTGADDLFGGGGLAPGPDPRRRTRSRS